MLNKTFLISALLACPVLALASATSTNLATHLSSQITQINDAFDRAIAEQSSLPSTDLATGSAKEVTEGESEVELRQFFLTVAPQASFGISGTLDLEISPEVTFVWEKTE